MRALCLITAGNIAEYKHYPTESNMLFLKQGHGLPTSFKKMSILAFDSDPRENRRNKNLHVHYMPEVTSSLHSLETSQPSQGGFSSHFHPPPHPHTQTLGSQWRTNCPSFAFLYLSVSPLFTAFFPGLQIPKAGTVSHLFL